MALQDHFRPPLSVRRHWHAFHNGWATYVSSDLNQQLPPGYFAEANVQFGMEIDVVTFEEAEPAPPGKTSPREGIDCTIAGSRARWTAPPPTRTIPIALLTDTVEVLVFDREAGPTLAGAIELISPANQDRPDHRDAFVSKCAAYLQQGVGLVVVDIVTNRRANLHDELSTRLQAANAVPWGAELYAVSYRPVSRASQPCLDIWQVSMAVASSLPTMPLWLRGNLCFPVDLDVTYTRTCLEQRIMVNGA